LKEAAKNLWRRANWNDGFSDGHNDLGSDPTVNAVMNFRPQVISRRVFCALG
jgi:hypothetical protein